MSRPFFETWDLAPALPPNAQRIRDAVDVVEPRRDQGNLQDGFIVESRGPQRLWSSCEIFVASFVSFTT